MTRPIGYCIFTFEGGDWTNDNFAGLDHGFAEAKKLGYAYVEVPSYVFRAGAPRDQMQLLHRLGRVLDMSERHKLPLSAIFCAAELLTEETREEEIDQLVVLARFASTLGVTNLPVTLSMRTTGGGTDDAKKLAPIVSEVGRRTLEVGVKLAPHPHIDCPLETPEQIDAFYDAADPNSVFLALDTGHVLAGGGDPVAIAKRYADRITYLHIKDLDVDAYRELSGKGGREKYAAFRDPGAGSVDVGGVLTTLTEVGFDGPILVENDISPDPVGSMASAYRYLREALAV